MGFIRLMPAFVCGIGVSAVLYNSLRRFGDRRKLFIKKIYGHIRGNRFLNAVKKREKWLRQTGVGYMMGHDVKVISFYLLQLLCGSVAVLIFLVCTRGNINKLRLIWCGFAFLSGLYTPVIFLELSNRMDNSMMLEDIKQIYDTLKIQSRAGVFVTDILSECYLHVKTPRLRDAMRCLANQIYAKHDMGQALTAFNSRFKNIYIDMLAMTLEQSVKSGQTVRMLKDISQQIQEVEQILYQKEKKRVENHILAYQLAVYFAILMVVVYAMFIQLMDAFSF